MRVQVIRRNTGDVPTGWCVVDDEGIPVREVVRYLQYLDNVERSPLTSRSYAYDLSAYLTFLDKQGLSLDDVTNDILGRFARSLRMPSSGVVAVADDQAARARTTVNRALAAVASFYAYLSSEGPDAIGYAGHQRLNPQHPSSGELMWGFSITSEVLVSIGNVNGSVHAFLQDRPH